VNDTIEAMEWLEAIILGLIQGLTEFIPISSSGHIVVAQTFISGASDHLFVEFINVGTVLALIVFFRHRIVQLVKGVFIHRQYRLARNIILTAIPAGVVGFSFAHIISSTPFFSSAATVVFTLAIVGVVMILIDRLPQASKVETGEKLSIRRALIIGVAQTLAFIPGTSRSGATILAGRFMGLSSTQAAEYSFLVSIPIMLGVTLKLFLFDFEYLSANAGIFIVSNAAAFISGMFAVGFLMRYLSKHSLALFGWYRVALSVVVATILLVQ